MLEKIKFQNGVIVKSQYLNEVQKGSVISTTSPRSEYYSDPSELDHELWDIAQRDAIKDWEIAHPDIESETNIGRLAHDGVLWGCTNCAETDLDEIEVSFNIRPNITRKDLDNSILGNNQIGVVVGSGKILDETLQVVEWPTTVVVVSPNATNYIYAYYDNSEVVLVANTTLPSRASLYTSLARVEIDETSEITNVVDLRHGVYIDSLLNRFDNLRNTELISANTTLQTWQRALVDTANGEIYITLPADAVNNDLVSVVDAVGTFSNFPVHILPGGDKKINNSSATLTISKTNAQVNLFFFEPLNTWLFSDDFLSEDYKELGEFISCGGWECIGVTQPEDCPDGQAIPPIFPDPSEGVYFYESQSSKCFKKLSPHISVYSDGKGGYTKLFGEKRCARSSDTTKSEARVIKVDLALGNDHIANSGTLVPFKTVERALLESAYRSKDFDKISIEVSQDTYYIDNSLGSDFESIRTLDDSGLYFRTYTDYNVAFVGADYIVAMHSSEETVLGQIPRGLEIGRVIYTESGASGVISKVSYKNICTTDCGWILELRYLTGTISMDEKIYFDNFAVLNPATGGVIVPNGVSLVSKDLRKTKIHPRYVPSIRDSSEPTSILKLTGNSYVSGFTFADNEMFTQSHTKLAVAEFVSERELEIYYLGKLKTLYEIDRTYVPRLDSNEIGIVSPTTIDSLSRLTDNYENLTGTEDFRTDQSESNGDSAPYSEGGLTYFPGKIKFEGFIIPDVNNTRGSSPYLKTCSVRSNFGLCGVLVDGDKVKGFKSMLVSEFTVVSIQLDPECYIDPEVTYYNLPTDSVDPKQYKPETRSYGFKVINNGYAQVVSCFVIGAADHFVSESGGEISISNSCSNFGDKSLVSHGFKSAALPQDASAEVDLGREYFGTRISKIIRPKPVSLQPTKVSTKLSIDVNATLAHYTSPLAYRLYLRGPEPSAELLGEYSYTSVDSGVVSLSTGLNPERGSLVVDAVEYVGGRIVRNSYSALIDDTALVYNPDLDDKIQIFKYDPNPGVTEQNVTGTYNLDYMTSVLGRSDIITLPASITEGSYFYINSDKTQVYTITRVIDNTATFTPELVGSSVVDAQITLVSNDFLGGLWYVDVKDPDTDNKLSEGLSVVAQNSPVYVRRDIDTRSDSDRLYKVVLKGFDLDFGLRPPQVDYVLEASADYNAAINTDSTPLVLRSLSKVSDGEYEAIVVTSDNFDAELYPEKDLDTPELTENPETSISYQAVSKLAQYQYINIEPEHLVANSNPFNITYKNSSAPFLIELRKPSVIRANSHTWEWVGYLNYDSVFVQTGSFDNQAQLDKLISESSGGKVYATGSTEVGQLIVGSKFASLASTVAQVSLPTSLDTLGINSSLELSPFSTLNLDLQTSLQISGSTRLLNELGTTLNSNNSNYESYASTAKAGFVQLASQLEVDAGTSANTAITPETLQAKKASDNFYGISKLSNAAEVREWITTGAGNNPTDVVTNQSLGSNLVLLNTAKSLASDLRFTLSATGAPATIQSSSLWVWGSLVSLWKDNSWDIVRVPNSESFNLEEIGATVPNTLYNVYAYVNDSDEFKLACSSVTTTLEDGIVVASSDKRYRFVGKVYVYSSNGAILSASNLSGSPADVPKLYYSNFLNPSAIALNLLFEEDFPTIISSMAGWDSPASANSAYEPGTSYEHIPKISFVSAIEQNIRAEATLLTSYDYSVANPNQLAEYVHTAVGMNLGSMDSTPVNAVHSRCLVGSTVARLSTCQASLSTRAEARALDLVYVFKSTIVGTQATDIIHNKNLLGLNHGLRLTLEA